MKRHTLLLLMAIIGCLYSSAQYPAIEDLLLNKYKVTTGKFSLEQKTYASYFTPEFEFTISGTNSSPILHDFLYEGSVFNCSYDQASGVLTITVITLRPNGNGQWLAFAPEEGGFQGISVANGNPLKLQLDSEGNISIPNFSIGTYNTSGPSLVKTYASYADMEVTIEGKVEDPTKIPEKSFAGTYYFTGTKTDYTDPNNPVTSPFDFELVIEYDENSYWPNRLVEIAGYKLSEENVEYKNTLYTVNGNTLAYLTAPSNGIIFEQEAGVESEDPEATYINSYIFGGNNVRRWNQNENSVVFTLESENEYSLQPFTIWHNYWVENKNTDENGDTNNTRENIKEVVFRWEGKMSGIELPCAEIPDSKPRYFNLSGVEVTNPERGIFIKVENGKATKVLH